MSNVKADSQADVVERAATGVHRLQLVYIGGSIAFLGCIATKAMSKLLWLVLNRVFGANNETW